jgi:microcystin-dependent protein
MNDCTNCDPCPPCETQVPETCEALPTTNDPKRLVVEDSGFCKKTIVEPSEISVLQYDENNDVSWRDGSLANPVKLPLLDAHTIDNIPSILVLKADGTIKKWNPSNAADEYIAYWDGSNWRVGNLVSLLPAGNGVLTSNGTTLSFVNGVSGDFLQIIGGAIQFSSAIPGGTPTGLVAPFAGAAAPSGWILCDGSAYGRTSLDPSPQVALFGVIGTTYGAGDGLTTFNVPDLRGMFVRGLDAGRGIDPARALGTQQAFGTQAHNHTGVTGGQSVDHSHAFSGTTGVDSPDHTHNSTYLSYTSPPQVAGGSSDAWRGVGGLSTTSGASTRHTHAFSGTTGLNNVDHTHTIPSFGITETRPVNVAMNFIIKT